MIKFKLAKKQQDIALVSSLAYEIWRDYYYSIVGVDQTEYMLNKFQSETAIKNALTLGYEYYLVKENSLPVGYMGIQKDIEKQELFLSKFYLLKDHRKKGIFSLAIEELKEMAKQNNLSRIWLTVNKQNSASLAYEKLGLIQEKSVNDPIGNGYFMNDYIYSLYV